MKTRNKKEGKKNNTYTLAKQSIQKKETRSKQIKENGKKDKHKQTVNQPTNQPNKHTKKQNLKSKHRNAKTTIKS